MLSTTVALILVSVAAQPPAVGLNDNEAIRRIIHSHRSEIRDCYKVDLERPPALSGIIVIRFTIIADGTVGDAIAVKNTLSSEAVMSCVVSATKSWTFPHPKNGGRVVMTYPWRFKTIGDGGRPGVAEAGEARVIVT